MQTLILHPCCNLLRSVRLGNPLVSDESADISYLLSFIINNYLLYQSLIGQQNTSVIWYPVNGFTDFRRIISEQINLWYLLTERIAYAKRTGSYKRH